jgi:hypothetical protein
MVASQMDSKRAISPSSTFSFEDLYFSESLNRHFEVQ